MVFLGQWNTWTRGALVSFTKVIIVSEVFDCKHWIYVLGTQNSGRSDEFMIPPPHLTDAPENARVLLCIEAVCLWGNNIFGIAIWKYLSLFVGERIEEDQNRTVALKFVKVILDGLKKMLARWNYVEVNLAKPAKIFLKKKTVNPCHWAVHLFLFIHFIK